MKWGMCSKACQDIRDTFQFTNMNLLNDDECKELAKRATVTQEARNKNGNLGINYETEICAGKKHNFPKDITSFERKKKRKKKIKEEEEQAKKRGNRAQAHKIPLCYKKET